jgi:tetratricopeptide (TPR) repeat protein
MRRGQTRTLPYTPEDEDDQEDPEKGSRLEYDYSAAPVSRRKSHRHKHWYRRLARYSVAAAVLLLLAGTAYFSYKLLLRPAMISPGELRASAESLFKEGNYMDAYRAFAQYAKRYPDDPYKPEAQFNAAFSLELAAPASRDAGRADREQALGLFQAFVKENPSHKKRPRAEAIMGVLQYDLGNYGEVVRLLRDSTRQVDDPEAALPMLRRLAWAYRMEGDFDQAESTFLQAAVLPKNYSPDVDYYDLGDMARKRAELAQSPPDKAKFQKDAVDYWTMAIRVPGIDPVKRDEIEKQLEWLETETGVKPDQAALDFDTEAAAVPAAAEPTPDNALPAKAEPPSESTPAPALKEWEPDPAVEEPQPANTAQTSGS